jgi:hypothetical protein
MPQVIEAFLQELQNAARNPFAFISYAFTLVAWIVVSVLNIPHKHALQAIKVAAPGTDLIALADTFLPQRFKLKGGLTAQQELEGRLHFYKLIKFCTLCGTVLMIVAIAVWYAVQRMGRVDVTYTLHS